ncbi:hypothetical protein H4Q26_013551 [Puccinia striiformis f. sp. tritici PST-130]|nr:hypothetical protein H4Q26_013551 [Puccinia striiformis f. sp. tritici PST-130]
MEGNQPTREELVAVDALLEQKRQTAVDYLQTCRRSRLADSNGGTDGDALDEISARNANHDSGPAGETRNGRNQLREILGTLGDPQGKRISKTDRYLKEMPHRDALIGCPTRMPPGEMITLPRLRCLVARDASFREVWNWTMELT